VVSKAESLNLKLIVPLLNGLDDLGGINTYVNNYGGSPTSFFTDKSSQTAYLAYVDFIVDRYKDSPAIFSWELCNEPRCANCDTSVITNWTTSVSAHIKARDPKHLVSLGDEGWFAPPYAAPKGANTYPYQGNNGIDFVKNLAISTIDFGTFHMYPGQFSETDDWGNTYIREHDQAGRNAGKPVILEEYGSTDSPKTKAMSLWQATLESTSTKIAMDFFWQFEETLSKGFKPASDGYGIQYDTTSGSEYDVLAIQHAKAMTGKAVNR